MRKPKIYLVMATVSAMIMMGACSEQRQEIKKAEGLSVEKQLGPAADKLEAMPVPQAFEGLADLARKDLSGILKVPAEEIEFLSGKFVTWRDASLGCPQPGMAYAQVLSNGSLIKLRAQGKLYQYHSGEKRAPFLCRNPSKNEPLPYEFGET